MMHFPFLNPESDGPTLAQERTQRQQQSRDELKLVSLNEFLQPLVAAVGQRQPWVDDFGDDKVMLSADLYEVIREFAKLQPGAATAQS